MIPLIPFHVAWVLCDTLGAGLWLWSARGDRPLASWAAIKLLAFGTGILIFTLWKASA